LAEGPGKAAAAYHGLREATGEWLVVLDLDKGYAPADLARVLEPLARGEADVVIATSSHGHAPRGDLHPAPGVPLRRPPGWVSLLARPLIGIPAPSAGLVAVTRDSYLARGEPPKPLGSRFVLELLVGAVGRRIEVPMARRVKPRPYGLGP